jgi:hypothetical protein
MARAAERHRNYILFDAILLAADKTADASNPRQTERCTTMSLLRLVPDLQQDGALATPTACETLADEPLLRFAGPVGGSHALIIAANGADLLCGLLRRGCTEALLLRNAQKSDREAYDLVVAPRIVSATQVPQLIYQAKRALVPTGRFLAFVPAQSVQPEEDVAGLLVRSVRLGGFVAVQTKTLADGLLVRADLPMAGWLSAQPIRRQA